MISQILTLLLSLRAQNCSVGMMIGNVNKTPILRSTFNMMNNENSEVFSIMLPESKTINLNTNTLLALSASYLYIGEFTGPMSKLDATITDCFVLMMENVLTFENTHSILMKTGGKKLIVVVGHHNFNKVDTSDVPIAHINKFGHTQIYCPTFNYKFWKGKMVRAENSQLDMSTEVCPIHSYIRYVIMYKVSQ